MAITIEEGKHPRNYWTEDDKPQECFSGTERTLFELWAGGATGAPFDGAAWAHTLLANTDFYNLMQENGQRHSEKVLEMLRTSPRPLEDLMVLIDTLPRLDAFTLLHLIVAIEPDIVKSARDAIEKSTLSNRGKKGAAARYKNDPKQKAKSFMHECWRDWQKNPSRYRKQSDFVTDVLTKIDVDERGLPIVSFDTVQKKWIPEWTREAKAQAKK